MTLNRDTQHRPAIKQRTLLVLIVVLMVAIATIPMTQSSAQSNIVTITVAVPTFSRDNFTDAMVKDFQAVYPNIKLQFVSSDFRPTSVTSNLSTHFDDVQKYVSSADVVYVDSSSLSVESTLAGYFLDLSPLVASDKTLNADDFYPAVWQAFQWNKGIWAIPNGANPYILSYKPSDFDKAGIAYPSEKWTLDDLMIAVDKLTVKDANGKVTQKGLALNGGTAQQALFRSLIGATLVDESQIPNPPVLDSATTESLLDAWNQRLTAGSIGFDNSGTASISITSISDLSRPGQNATGADKRIGLLLPGGKSGMDVQGFAVSKGTTNPEQAYVVAAYFSTRTDTRGGFSSSAARQSLAGQSSNNNAGGGPRPPNANISADTQALIDKALATGFGLSDMRFVDYVGTALQNMQKNSVDAKSALQTIEATAVANEKTAITKKDSLAINLATPVPVKLAAGKIQLNFGIRSNIGPVANQDRWKQLADSFIASDSQVGAINIQTPGFQTQVSDMAAKYDCFYLSNNQVQNIDIKTILNLDPYLNADTSFNKSDIVGGVLDQLTRDNKIWAIPISIEPAILKYDTQKFTNAGLTVPAGGWTVDSFADALKNLKLNPTDDAPLIPSGTGGSHLLILIASYGGLPIDFRTNPPTFNYTDPDTMNAIQQVLDLAKNGYIKYTKLGTMGFNFGSGASGATIYTASLNAFNFGPGGPGGGNANTTSATTTTYSSTSYPKGTKYNGVSYTIGTAYISATTQNADACYRWISQIAKNPDLFSAMPVQKSLIDSSTQSADLKILYKQMADLLANPNTISIPSLQGAQQSMFYQLWLFQAFDAYVLNNGDLPAALKDAQEKSTALAQCTANIPAFDASSQDSATAYFKQYSACVTKADPSLSSAFN